MSLVMSLTASESHGLGGNRDGQYYDPKRESTTQPYGMESACSGLPEQRSACYSVVCRAQHQSENLLQLAEESICGHGRSTEALDGSTSGGKAKVCRTPATGCTE